MNLKLFVGIVLFLTGIATAIIGISGVAVPDTPQAVVADESTLQRFLGAFAIPLIAALSLGVGGLLIGLSMGNWKHPRTHLEPGDEIVDPEGYHKMKHV